ncbi:MAG: hypothetical protein ABII23_01765, partial [bacterium]
MFKNIYIITIASIVTVGSILAIYYTSACSAEIGYLAPPQLQNIIFHRASHKTGASPRPKKIKEHTVNGNIVIEEDDISNLSLKHIPHDELIARLEIIVKEFGIFPQADRSGFLELLKIEPAGLRKIINELKKATERFDCAANYQDYPRLLVWKTKQKFEAFIQLLCNAPTQTHAEQIIENMIKKIYPAWLITFPVMQTEPLLYEEIKAETEIEKQKERNENLEKTVAGCSEEEKEPLASRENSQWRYFTYLLHEYYKTPKKSITKRRSILSQLQEIKQVKGSFNHSGRLRFCKVRARSYIDLNLEKHADAKIIVRPEIEGDRVRIAVYRLGDDFHHIACFYYNEDLGKKIYLQEQLGRWLHGAVDETRPCKPVLLKINSAGKISINVGTEKNIRYFFNMGGHTGGYLKDIEVLVYCRKHTNGQKMIYCRFNPEGPIVALGFFQDDRMSIEKIFGPNNNQKDGRAVLPVLLMLGIIRSIEPVCNEHTACQINSDTSQKGIIPVKAHFKFKDQPIDLEASMVLPGENSASMEVTAKSYSAGKGIVLMRVFKDKEEILRK